MTDALYNEIDPYPAAWLRNLIAADHIPPGHVDERSIADLTADDVSDRAQVHFFAGIGGWNHALELAGWPAARPVWTGSCPCQPFSQAGKQKGASDERHLWPEMRRLIAECQPPVVFGEQVASKLGRDWLAGVRADLEALGYAVGSADLCAAGVGAPHIRQRLYWGAIRLADADQRERGRVANGQGRQHDGQTTGRQQGDGFAQSSGASGWLADADSPRRSKRSETTKATGYGRPAGAEGWSGAYWHECLDGKARRIPAEPAFFPLADGVPGRVGQLRAYGNAIVPQVAAAFITAFMEAQHD
jgi:DNA (cytosine-5)-methyltransferase 1